MSLSKNKIYTTEYFDYYKGKNFSLKYLPYPQYIISPFTISSTECYDLVNIARNSFEYYKGARFENPKEKNYQSKWEAELEFSAFPSIRANIMRDFFYANTTYKFDLLGIIPCLSIFSYKKGDHLNSHLDFNYDAVKLSSITLLTNSFKGGDFLIGPQLENVRLKKGQTIIFPSWQIHQVNKVSKGERVVMANWAVGGRFR